MENAVNWRDYSEKIGENIRKSWQTRKKKHPNRPSTAPKSLQHHYRNNQSCISKTMTEKKERSWNERKTQRTITRQFHPEPRNMQKGTRYFDYDFEMKKRKDTPIILEDLPSIFCRRAPTPYTKERRDSRMKPALHCIDMSLEV